MGRPNLVHTMISEICTQVLYVLVIFEQLKLKYIPYSKKEVGELLSIILMSMRPPMGNVIYKTF